MDVRDWEVIIIATNSNKPIFFILLSPFKAVLYFLKTGSEEKHFPVFIIAYLCLSIKNGWFYLITI